MEIEINSIKIEIEKGETGLKSITLTALETQGEIDLDMEYPRILKLLRRDWLRPNEQV